MIMLITRLIPILINKYCCLCCFYHHNPSHFSYIMSHIIRVKSRPTLYSKTEFGLTEKLTMKALTEWKTKNVVQRLQQANSPAAVLWMSVKIRLKLWSISQLQNEIFAPRSIDKFPLIIAKKLVVSFLTQSQNTLIQLIPDAECQK